MAMNASDVSTIMKRRILMVNAIIAALALLSAATITPALAQPSYTQLLKATAATTPGSVMLSVTTGGNIPRFPDSFIQSVLVFGYAWVNTNNGQGLVAVIHPNFKDSFQNPSAWHTHTVVLSSGTSTSNFCIQQLGTSEGGLTIINNVLGVNTGTAQAGTFVPNVGASFVVQHDPGCTATGLGVKVLSSAAVTH
jgi:hypothetical protein